MRRSPAPAAQAPATGAQAQGAPHAAAQAQEQGAVVDYLGASSGRGQPLQEGVRSSFESSLGVGLGNVRILADSAAGDAAAALGARAFTLGSTIWFGHGQYRPGTPAGRRLLAHEVAHTVQQQGTAPSIQREVLVGSSHDPAETVADRAADAIMRGERAYLAGGGAPVLRRTCTPEGEPRNDQLMVNCDGTRWQVTHRVEQPPPPSREPEWRGDVDMNYRGGVLSVEFWVCRGGTAFTATLSDNIEQDALPILSNLIARQAALRNITFRPNLALVLTHSGRWTVTLQGGPVIDAEHGRVQSVGGTLEVTPTPNYGPIVLGVDYTPATPGTGGMPGESERTDVTVRVPLETSQQRIPTIDCSRLPPARPRHVFECRPIVPDSRYTFHVPPVRQQPRTRVYVLFEFERDTIIGWHFEDDPAGLIRPPTDPYIRSHFTELILSGYGITSVIGRTSPEGRMQQTPGRHAHPWFHGNRPLANARATAAYNAVFNDVCLACPTYQNRLVIPIGEPELYSPPPVGGQEVEGPALEAAAIPAYTLLDPMAPADLTAFAGLPPDQQRSQAYAMLRRAEITLERNPIRIPAYTGHGGEPEHTGGVDTCPRDITANAPRWFHTDILPTP